MLVSKKYFVVSDIHNHYTELIEALETEGWSIDNDEHILIVCGDAFDRGLEALKLYDFLIDLQDKNRLVYVKGNHDDLLLRLCGEGGIASDEFLLHFHNGTIITYRDFGNHPLNVLEKFNKLYHNMVDYYELGDYIFVHGWIPYNGNHINPTFDDDWKNGHWDKARWSNGMELWLKGIKIPNKTIVCGHWNSGWGHFNIHKEGEDEYDNFDIFKDKGIIALDGMTSYSGQVNVLVIEEGDLNDTK